MSRIDQLTGRGPSFGNSRSHSNVATKRRRNLNLQTVRIGGLKLRISARTMKTLKKLERQAQGKLLGLKQNETNKSVAAPAGTT